MPSVEIYTTNTCPYCYLAKAILREHGADFDEHSLSEHPELFATMIVRAKGRKTVPQIFIDGVPIGGADQLALLEERGELRRLLSREPGGVM